MEYRSSETETDIASSLNNGDSDSSIDSLSDTGSYSGNGNEKPVQVVKLSRSTDGEDTLMVNVIPDALNKVLSTCGDRRICIISIVGGVRTGKSFLLNCIKEHLKDLEESSGGGRSNIKTKAYRGFHFKPGYKPITKGIWLWSRAFIAEDEDGEVAILLMDTEGINDELSKPDEIAAILGISLLSSSLLIVNSTGNLSLQEFDWLSRFFGKGAQQFQKLSFLVRDWTQVNIHKHGQKGGKRYLDKHFKHNGPRCEAVTHHFQETDCFLLPHIGERPLLEGFSGQTSEVNKNFLKSLKSYLRNLLDAKGVPTKKIFENDVRSQEFKAFFLEYVNFFNDGQNMDMGLKPESIMSMTRQIAGKIKIDRALEEYLKAFTRTAKGTHIHDSTLDGMHVPAKKKALQAFKKWQLSSEDEKYFSQMLDQELKKKHLGLKSDNQASNRKKLSENLEKACSKMKRELDRHFPFTPPKGMNFSADLVFYDAKILQERQEKIRGSAEEEFLKEYAQEDDEERKKLQKKLQSKLKQIEEESTQRNNDNLKRAEDEANALVEKLVKEYKTAMQRKLKRLPPNVESHIMDFVHGDELEKVEQSFAVVTIGVPEFQEKWQEHLGKRIEIEYESMQGNLETRLAKANELINEEEQKYRQRLTEMLTKLQEQQELQEFHKKSVKSIVKDFQNPFSKNSPNFVKVEKQLQEKIDHVYQSIVEGGALERIKMEDQMGKAIETAVGNLQASLAKKQEDSNYLDMEECLQFLTQAHEKSLNWLLKELQKIGIGEQETIDKGKQQLSAKANKMLSSFQKKNKETKEALFVQADKLLKAGVEDYENKIKKIKKTVETIEELEMEHEKIKKLVTDQFTSRFPTKNTTARREYLEKLEIKIQENFDEMENILRMKLKVVDASYNSARHQAETHYKENMDTKFDNNKGGFFKEEDLNKMHLSIHAAATASVKVDPPLNEFQWKKLNEQIEKLHLKYKRKNDLIKHTFEKEPAIGIDLGTTYSCVAVYHMGSVKVLLNGQGNNTTPSYVAINADGSAMVGQPAKDVAYRNPESTIFDAKRIIGRRLDDEKLQEDMKYWPFTVEDVAGKAKIKVRDQYYYPEEISAKLLENLKKEAEDRLGLKIKKAVITVPAYFTDGQRQATIDAGEIAGLEVLGILNEPTAAAIAYRLESYVAGKSRKILVYDLGGGTFDVAVLEISDKKIDVLSISGDSHLGGEDFDKNIMRYCAEEFHKAKEVDLFEGKDSEISKVKRDDARRRLKRLQNQCESSKKALTNQRKVEMPVTISIDEVVRGQDLNVDVNRKIFDEKNMALFKKTIEIVDEAINSAGLKKEEIDDVVMVGGSTRIPKLQEMLEEHFKGKALNKSLNPDEAIAYGAAVQAAILNAKLDSAVFDFGMIQEVTPMSLGIELADKAMSVIIPRNKKIPVTHTENYTTHHDNQTSTTISIYQGEQKIAKDNKLLGKFVLSGIPKGPAGKETINVTMKINQNGILTVEATCRGTKAANSITVSEQRVGLTEKEKLALTKNAKTLA